MKKTALILLLLTLAACTGEAPEDTAPERSPITGVETAEAAVVKTPLYLETTGTVRAGTRSTLSAKTAGEVTSIRASEGERVKKGAVVATIDEEAARRRVSALEAATDEAASALEAAREEKALADATFKRYENLYREGAVTDQEFDTVRTRMGTAAHALERTRAALRRAEASLAGARIRLGHSTVQAPFDALVVEKHVDQGETAAPGTPLLTIEDTSSYTVHVRADERYLGGITPGTRTEVEVPSTGKAYDLTVSEAVDSVDPATRTFLLKIRLPGDGLGEGQFARVRVPVGEREVLTVPESAVVKRGQLTGVYLVDTEGVAIFTLIRAGKARAGRVEVLSGLNPGDRVITKGVERAVDGGVVEAQRGGS